MSIATALKAADYLLWYAAPFGDGISNLKAQKMLYYAQGWYLAEHDEVLFRDPIEAWPRGPVVAKVYGVYRHDRLIDGPAWAPVPPPSTEPAIRNAAKAHIQEIWDRYGDFSARTLELMTHEEPPWRNARGDLSPTDSSNNVIEVDDMRAHFKSLLDAR